MMINPLNKSFWRKLVKQELGFTLLEVVAAVFIAGTVVVGSVVVMGTAVRSSARVEGNLDLQPLVQTQIEIIQNAPFSKVGNYPSITTAVTGVPEQINVTFAVTGTKTNYQFPDNGDLVQNVVQRVDVTASVTGGSSVTMSFYKIEP